jgi:hypothetical protein
LGKGVGGAALGIFGGFLAAGGFLTPFTFLDFLFGIAGAGIGLVTLDTPMPWFWGAGVEGLPMPFLANAAHTLSEINFQTASWSSGLNISSNRISGLLFIYLSRKQKTSP